MIPSFPTAYLAKPVCAKTRALKFSAGKCYHRGCRNAKRRNAADCNTCHCRKVRLNNPARYVFGEVRNSARKRGIGFLLSFPEFMEFCNRTGYLDRVGKDSDSLTIDRVFSNLPYSATNIRALTWLENCSKLVEGMKDPAEPIARALAKAAKKAPEAFGPFMKDARAILSQVETLQRLEREHAEQEEANAKDPDKTPF